MRNVKLFIPGLFRDKWIDCDIPSDYRELSERQFRVICAVSRGEIPAEEYVMRLAGLSVEMWNKLDKFYHWLLTQIVSEIKPSKRISSFYYKNVSVGGKHLCTPRLATMPLMQFMVVDTFAQWYQYDGNMNHLINFLASLCLPAGTSFFDYDSSDVTLCLQNILSMHKTSGVEEALMKDLVLNWQLIRTYLSEEYPNMFPTAEEGSADEGKKSRPTEWSEVFDSLIGEKLECIEQYKRLPALDVFRIVDTRIRNRKFNQ